MMDMFNSLFSYFSSPHSCSSRPPQAPSPPSQEPTTSSGNSASGGDNSKPGLENSPKRVEYLDVPPGPQDPSLLFRFMVYASRGTLPSEVKKVTREAPKRRKGIFNRDSSEQTTQYSWVVRRRCYKKRRKSKEPLENETLQADTGDVATHEEDAHKEDVHEKDTHEEETLCERSVHEKRSKKFVTFDMSANPPRKSALKATSRDSAPAPSPWRFRAGYY